MPFVSNACRGEAEVLTIMFQWVQQTMSGPSLGTLSPSTTRISEKKPAVKQAALGLTD